ncbi:deoxyribose-phosphate aldolase, partial [human gut metagenome]
CYSAIDLTTLSCNDSATSVTEFARKAVEFYQAYPHIPNVASICIYPAFVETVGVAVDGTPMRITSVAGGFPASQTYLEVKALEVAMAVKTEPTKSTSCSTWAGCLPESTTRRPTRWR